MYFLSLLVALIALVVAGPAAAQVALPDVSGDIGAVMTFIVAVGSGVLGLIFAAKAFKWARRAG